MSINNFHRPIEVFPEEGRLVQQAKSGDTDAFVQLYDAYVGHVYRYVFFRVINDLVAEDITLHVFRNAWEHLARYQKFGSSFIGWLDKIARKLVIDYYKTDIKNHAFNVRILEPMARSVEDLDLGNAHQLSPAFNTHTRTWLTQYLKFHTRHPQKARVPLRTSLSLAGLIAALLVTGTAHAQSALPGELFYGWKRTSEEAWRTFSPDPVGTDIMLADRRLHEWIAVENDPARRVNAMHDYYEELTNLKPKGNAQARARILPVLTAQKQVLNNAGLSTIKLNEFLVAAVGPGTALTPTPVSLTKIAKTVTEAPAIIIALSATSVHSVVPTEAAPTMIPTVVPTEVAPTEVPTQVPPPTEVPTQVPPPTEVPTQVPPPTDVPTQVPPPTDVATQAPPPTDVATEAPPPTDVATEAPPPTDAPTQAPPATDPPTQEPQATPIPVAPTSAGGSIDSGSLQATDVPADPSAPATDASVNSGQLVQDVPAASPNTGASVNSAAPAPDVPAAPPDTGASVNSAAPVPQPLTDASGNSIPPASNGSAAPTP